MQELVTIGANYYPKVKVPLRVIRNLGYIPDIEFHITYQLIILEEGSGVLRINDKRVLLQPPEVYCINELEKVTLEKGERLKIHIIYFKPEMLDLNFDFSYVRNKSRENVMDTQVLDLFWLNSFLYRDENMTGRYSMNQFMLQRLINLQECMMNELENQSTRQWICRARSCFLEILCYLSKLNAIKPSDIGVALTSQSEMIEDILLYLHTNYAQRITLGFLTEKFHMNRTTMNELFHRITGAPVITYLIKLRIDLSAALLKDTGISVKEIAYRVGFEDTINFTRTFKKQKGCNPTQYRRENSWLLQMC